MDRERNLELGKVAYEVYRCRLGEHQDMPEELTWDRLPPYMHDTWVMVAEVVELYVRDRNGHHK